MPTPSTAPKKTSVSTSEITEWPYDVCGRVEFSNYILEKINTDNWALCRNTKHNRARYGTCLSQSKYKAFQRQYLKDGGDPNQVDQKIAEEYGWVLRWVRPVPAAQPLTNERESL